MSNDCACGRDAGFLVSEHPTEPFDEVNPRRIVLEPRIASCPGECEEDVCLAYEPSYALVAYPAGRFGFITQASGEPLSVQVRFAPDAPAGASCGD